MKKILLTIISIAVFSLASFGQTRKIFPYKIHTKDLPNGLRLVAVPFDSPGIISYYTVVRVGSRNEVEPGLSGFAHFFEHMMFRGTPKYSNEKYHQILKELGVDSNAFTTDDWTCYHNTIPSSSLETIMDMEADRFQNLKYPLEDFQKEAKAVLGEYNKNASDPLRALLEAEHDTAFTTHTYKHTTLGFLKDVVDMPNQYEYSLKFFNRFYKPENCTVLVVGDVKPESFFKLATQYYGNWEKGNYVSQIPTEPAQTEEKTKKVDWQSPILPYLLISYHIPAFSSTNKDKASLDLLAKIAFSETSAIYQKLVLEEQRVDLFLSGAEDNRDPSLFEIIVRVKDEKDLPAVRDEILAKLEEFKTKPIQNDELANTKSNFRYQVAMGFETPDSIASVLAQYINLTGDPESLNKVFDLYDRITSSDIQQVAKKTFIKENRTVVILKGPNK